MHMQEQKKRWRNYSKNEIAVRSRKMNRAVKKNIVQAVIRKIERGIKETKEEKAESRYVLHVYKTVQFSEW